MSAGQSDYDIWMIFLTDFMKSIHTIKPAVVTSVNGNKVTCRITTQTRYSSNRLVQDQPDVEVPYLVISAKRGQARITVPIQVGDLVVVLFSDRSYGDLLDTEGKDSVYNPSVSTHNYSDPIIALPCFFTSSDTNTFSENVEIVHGDTSITIDDAGNTVINTQKIKITNGATDLISLLQSVATSAGNTSAASAIGQYVITG